MWHNVHSQQHTYVSSSYRSNRLDLLHWDPYAVRRGGFLELYYCNMVQWFWWDSSLISTTNWFPSVLWHCWFGHLACKNRPRNDLYCVEWDVKPYTLPLTLQSASNSQIFPWLLKLRLWTPQHYWYKYKYIISNRHIYMPITTMKSTFLSKPQYIYWHSAAFSVHWKLLSVSSYAYSGSITLNTMGKSTFSPTFPWPLSTANFGSFILSRLECDLHWKLTISRKVCNECRL